MDVSTDHAAHFHAGTPLAASTVATRHALRDVVDAYGQGDELTLRPSFGAAERYADPGPLAQRVCGHDSDHE